MKLIAIFTSRFDRYVKKFNSYFMQFKGFFLAVLELDMQVRDHKGDGID